jgi:hypothetical protein
MLGTGMLQRVMSCIVAHQHNAGISYVAAWPPTDLQALLTYVTLEMANIADL